MRLTRSGRFFSSLKQGTITLRVGLESIPAPDLPAGRMSWITISPGNLLKRIFAGAKRDGISAARWLWPADLRAWEGDSRAARCGGPRSEGERPWRFRCPLPPPRDPPPRPLDRGRPGGGSHGHTECSARLRGRG